MSSLNNVSASRIPLTTAKTPVARKGLPLILTVSFPEMEAESLESAAGMRRPSLGGARWGRLASKMRGTAATNVSLSMFFLFTAWRKRTRPRENERHSAGQGWDVQVSHADKPISR